uniref:Evasin n=1 Tax=Amblyomma cajennense TaxID=34607 RepID=A0A023FQC1_AMBCJ
MGFPWLLNLALLFVFETSVGDIIGGIPGCGDPTTTSAPEVPPKHFAVRTDKDGCTLMIIGTWMTTEDHNRLPPDIGEKRAPYGRVQLPASCKKNCHGKVKNLPNGTPCREVFGDPRRGRKHIKNGCTVGKCQSGLCVTDKRIISCYIPPNITDPIPTHGPWAE